MADSRLTPEQRKKRKKRRAVMCVIAAVLIVIIALVLVGVQKRVARNQVSKSAEEVQTAVAEVGSIRSTVSSSGSLTDKEYEEVTLPASVTLEEIYVEQGDSVEEGELLAVADTQTLIAAMASIQSELDELDEQMEDAGEDTVSDSITAKVSGRVKAVYVEEGDDIAAAMYENGALMVLSLDGYMAADITTDALATGDEVTVVTEDGTEYSGSVEQVLDGVATVLVTHKGPQLDETVEVYQDDELVGSGSLYIHSPLSITGYAGTVDSVEVSENEWVDAGDTLLTVGDTSYTANYEALLKQRHELEEKMQRLVEIYTEGGIYSPIAGTIQSVTYDEDDDSNTTGSTASSLLMSTAAEEDTEDSQLFTICPSDEIDVTVYVDESDILSLSVGLEAEITVDSISEESFTGEVTEVSTTATGSGGVTQYEVTLTMERTEQMRAGMSVSVYITISGSEDALRLPEDAVSRTSDVYYVYTGYDEETGELTGMQEVTVGVSGGGYTEITDGLEEGQTVYYIPDTGGDDFFSMFTSGGMSDMGSVDMSGFDGQMTEGGFSP